MTLPAFNNFSKPHLTVTSVSCVTLPSDRCRVCAPADAGGPGFLGTAGVHVPRGRDLGGGFSPFALSRILPPVLLLGISRNISEICSERCSAEEMESRDERRPEQEGAAGTCHPLRGVLGCRVAWGGPAATLQEHFGPQMGIGSTGQETEPGLAGGRRRSLKSQRCAVAPMAQGSASSSGQHRDPCSAGETEAQAVSSTASALHGRGGGSEGSRQVPPLPRLPDLGSQRGEKLICIDFY